MAREVFKEWHSLTAELTTFRRALLADLAVHERMVDGAHLRAAQWLALHGLVTVRVLDRTRRGPRHIACITNQGRARLQREERSHGS